MIQFNITVSTFPYEETPITQKFTLPMAFDELAEKTKVFGQKEFYIADIVDSYGFHIHEYTNLHLLNEFVAFLNNSGLDVETVKALATVEDTNLDRIREIIEEETYQILPAANVYADHEEDLGYTLYKEGMLNEDLPEDLVDKGYINFTGIGRDYSINQSWEYISSLEVYARTW
jgi:antirestriction protein